MVLYHSPSIRRLRRSCTKRPISIMTAFQLLVCKTGRRSHGSAQADCNFLLLANPSVPALYEDALVYETGSAITSTGALSAYSGAKTGRSPSDKRIVKEESSEKNVWWGPVNKPMTPEVSAQTPFFSSIPLRLPASFEELHKRARACCPR